ncbi:MAG: hypothetical protein JKX80_02220 [Candidatus Pacebacteria bacterium]|nr:hypothetical protein [Candidatus Paceibacterota bacterium]
MEDYTKNPIDSLKDSPKKGSGVATPLLALIILVAIGGVSVYVGSLFLNETIQGDNEELFEYSATRFDPLRKFGINTDLRGVSGIPRSELGTKSWSFRKTGEISFYEQQSSEMLESGDLQKWAEGQLVLSAAYIGQGGGENAQEASDALKVVIANREVSISKRAKAMRSLAGLYCRSGLDKRVFEAVYTGPYAEFYKEGDPMLAGKRMMEVSYNMSPRARTAVSHAHMYIDPIVTGDLSTEDKADARDKGLTFLRNAEVLARDIYNPRKISGEYASYLFWRAVSYGQLAMEYTEYISEAENAYTELFQYLDGYTGTFSTSVTDIIPFAHLRYVNFLTEVYGDAVSSDIETNLNTLVGLVEDDPNPEINIFIKYLENRRLNFEENGTYTRWLSSTRGYSAAYDALLDQYGLPDQSN